MIGWDRLQAGEPYRSGGTGWLVQSRARRPRADGRGEVEHVGYWFGPTNLWGKTFGPLDMACVRVADAEAAGLQVREYPATIGGAR